MVAQSTNRRGVFRSDEMIPLIFVIPPTISCPHCRTVLRRGKPRFGPSKVQCGHCGVIIGTKFKPWAEVSLIKKILIAISEIIGPSRWGAFPFVFLLNLISLFVYGFLLALFEVMVFDSIFKFPPIVSGIFNWGIIIVIVLSLIFRLIQLIRESNNFSRTNIPPVW